MSRAVTAVVTGAVVLATLLLTVCRPAPGLASVEDVRAALAATGECADLRDVRDVGTPTSRVAGDALLGAITCTDTWGEEATFVVLTSAEAREAAMDAALQDGSDVVASGADDGPWYAVSTSDELLDRLLGVGDHVHLAEAA